MASKLWHLLQPVLEFAQEIIETKSHIVSTRCEGWNPFATAVISDVKKRTCNKGDSTPKNFTEIQTNTKN